MAQLEKVERETYNTGTEIKEGLNFTWIINGSSLNAARVRTRMLTAKAFPLQWADELQFPPLRNVEIEKIDEGVFEPRPIGKSGLIKTWRVTVFMPTEDDTFSTPVDTIFKQAKKIFGRVT